MEGKKGKDLLLLVSVIVAAVLIAGAFIYSAGQKSEVAQNLEPAGSKATTSRPPKKVDATDHIRGNKDADIIVIEYSDLECPFCQTFHATMKQTLEFYGDRVAWVYRHFAIVHLPYSTEEAKATECAAELGGNDAFWTYTDRIFELSPPQNRLDLAKLPEIAAEIGLDVLDFNECAASNKYDAVIQAQLEEGRGVVQYGTPHSVIVNKKGEVLGVIPGALPFISDVPGRPGVKDLIDEALNRI